MEKRNKYLLIATIALLTYWIITKVIDVYKVHSMAGAIYELTSILAVLATFILPIVAIVFWVKGKFAWEKQYILPLIISITTIFVMIFMPFLHSQE